MDDLFEFPGVDDRAGAGFASSTRPTIKWWLKVFLGSVCLAVLGVGIVVLEWHRTDRRLREDVRIGEALSGQPNFAEFGERVTQRQWRYAQRFPAIRSLAFRGTTTLEDGLKPLAGFPNLQKLTIVDSPRVDDGALSALLLVPRLRFLTLQRVPITDSSLEVVTRLPHLESLSLASCPGVTGLAVEKLIGMVGLKQVNIEGTDIPFEAFVRLRLASEDLTILYHPSHRFPHVWTNSPRSPTGYHLTSEASPEEFEQFVSVPHDWTTGRYSRHWLERVTVVTLNGPHAAESVPTMLARLPALEQLSIPAWALAELEDDVRERLRGLDVVPVDPLPEGELPPLR